MKNITIHVDDDLRAEMRAIPHGAVNWSSVARAAFRVKLHELQRRDGLRAFAPLPERIVKHSGGRNA